MRSDEVLQYGHTLLEVGDDRVLNDLGTFCTGFLRFRHQTTHTGKLGNLISRTTGTGVEHHINSVEALISLGHVLHHTCLEVIVDVCPGIDDLIVTFLVRNETHFIVGLHLVNLVLPLAYDVFLLIRYDDIIEVEGQTGNIGHMVTEILDTVKELAGTCHADSLDDIGNETAERLLGNNAIKEANLGRDDLVDDDTTDRSLYHTLLYLSVDKVVNDDLYLCMEVASLLVVSNDGFL